MTTEIIIKKRSLDPSEFSFSPIASLRYQTLKNLFDFIDQNSHLKVIDISDHTTGSDLCFKVLDKNMEQYD